MQYRVVTVIAVAAHSTVDLLASKGLGSVCEVSISSGSAIVSVARCRFIFHTDLGHCGGQVGGKGRGDMVRTGADRADVEALFELGDDPALRTRFAEAGLGPCEQLVVRRELLPSGRTRSFLNGRLVPGEQLVALATGLVRPRKASTSRA